MKQRMTLESNIDSWIKICPGKLTSVSMVEYRNQLLKVRINDRLLESMIDSEVEQDSRRSFLNDLTFPCSKVINYSGSFSW